MLSFYAIRRYTENKSLRFAFLHISKAATRTWPLVAAFVV